MGKTAEVLDSGRQAELQAAIEAAEKLSARNPLDARPSMILAEAYAALGNPEKRTLHTARIVKLRPKDARLRLQHASALVDAGDYVRAERHARVATELEPNDPDAWCVLSEALRLGGHPKQALASARIALAYTPGHPLARTTLAFALEATGKMEAACDAFRAAIDSEPDSADLWLGYLRCMMECNRHEQAIKLAQDALIYHDDNSELRLKIAELYEETGRTAAAATALRPISKGDPHYLRAKQQLARLNRHINKATRRVDPVAAPAKPLSGEVLRFEERRDQVSRRPEPQLPAPVREELAEALQRATGRRGARWRVIEVGCGKGELADILSPYAAHLTGVDDDLEWLRAARRTDRYDMLRYRPVDYPAPSVPAKSCDLVVAGDAISRAIDLKALFDTARDVLVRGGYFAFVVWSHAPKGFGRPKSEHFIPRKIEDINAIASESWFLPVYSVRTVVDQQKNGAVGLGRVMVFQRQ
jgi:predicted TPR repeat methyltransferase